jgi:hypothetical protein
MALFKYLPPERGLRVLAECELMVTPPRYLNDPFECSPVIKCKDPEAHASRRIDEIMGSPEFFERHRTHFPGLTFEDFQRGLHENRSQLLEQLVAGTPAVDSHIQDLVQEIVSKNFGVICFAADGLHQMMWAHYALSHEGLVIEFRPTHQLFSEPSFFEIEYSDERVVFDASNPAERDEAKRFLRRKGLRWSSERESRLIVELAKKTVHNLPEGCRYFIPIGPEIVVSVTLGLRATNETQDTVIELLQAPHFENVGLFKIRKNTEAGTFERERLQALRNS